MNWNRPVAELFDDLAFGLKLDSRIAVLSKYSKPVPVTREASRMAPTTLAPTSLAAPIAMLFARFAPSAFMVNGILTTVSDAGRSSMAQATATRHPRGGLYFEGFVPGEVFEHRLTRTVTQMDNMLYSNMT